MIKLIDIVKDQMIQQGVNDPGIFKAIFIIGPPASGKSTLLKLLLGREQLSSKNGYPSYSSASPQGLKYINIDDVFQKLIHTLKVNTNFNQLSEQQYQNIIGGPMSTFSKSKQLTTKRKNQYINSRLGLIIDKTGSSINSIQVIKDELEELGYQFYCIYVTVDLEVALQRNKRRVERSLKNQDIINM